METLQLIYASRPFGYDAAMLSGILLDARRCNSRDGVTGALVCRQDVYLQLLEGPQAQIDATYARIERDDRHANVKRLVRRVVNERMFADWDMLHDPAQTCHWSFEEIADGALERATEAEIRQVFTQLADRTRAS